MDLRKQNFRVEGFTRVSVLLGMALALVVISTLSLAPRMMRSASQASRLSDRPLHQGLQDALSVFVKSKIVQRVVPCGDPAAFFQSHPYLRTYTGTVGAMNGDLSAGVALNRCPLTILGTGGHFHFCLSLQQEASTPLIFAEVSLQLVDQRSGKSLSCAQYLEPNRGSAGALVHYRLFSIDDSGEDLEVTRKRASFSVSR